MNTKVEKLKDHDYRKAFIGSQVFTVIPYQVRALRKQQHMDQKALAAKADMRQSRISAIENPSGSGLNLDTLIRLAAAFDVGLLVRFVPFSELMRISDEFQPDSFNVPTFEEELKSGAFEAQSASKPAPTVVMQPYLAPASTEQTIGVWTPGKPIYAPIVTPAFNEQVPYGQVQ